MGCLIIVMDTALSMPIVKQKGASNVESKILRNLDSIQAEELSLYWCKVLKMCDD